VISGIATTVQQPEVQVNKRIGILGGTFNPVHSGHLILAQDAQELFELDRILFLPCRQPPHKDQAQIIAARHRLAMLRAALRGNADFKICRWELERSGPSYTIETIRALKAQHPEWDLAFIIGADTLPELHLWHEIEQLLELCPFVTLTRPGFEASALSAAQLQLPAPWPQILLSRTACGHRVDISSSEIRQRLRQKKSIRYLVPAAVANYIHKHSLYEEPHDNPQR
jgi:nicotinate-nucleotide adenylyltransferase